MKKSRTHAPSSSLSPAAGNAGGSEAAGNVWTEKEPLPAGSASAAQDAAEPAQADVAEEALTGKRSASKRAPRKKSSSPPPRKPTVVFTTAPAAPVPADFAVDRIVQGDCVAGLASLPPGTIDLAFADPPFNIGYEYDVYEDTRGREQYLDWCRQWIAGLYQALKPTGTFWLAIGDEYAAELKLLSQEIGFHCRSWVIWYYTFGVNCKAKFSRSHAHLFYFVKNPAEFTFRGDELENRIPSARQLVYADARANPTGRLPDDTWILRPQDLADCFSAEEDTWYFPRVAGTFKERAGFHGCQMPEQLLGRIIRFCSQPGELVLDPFAGSATTLAVAKKLQRHFLGFELSPEYARQGTQRLQSIRPGMPLDGAAEPTMSAPSTAKGKQRPTAAAVARTPQRSVAQRAPRQAVSKTNQATLPGLE